jgi:hypothetical protein
MSKVIAFVHDSLRVDCLRGVNGDRELCAASPIINRVACPGIPDMLPAAVHMIKVESVKLTFPLFFPKWPSQ